MPGAKLVTDLKYGGAIQLYCGYSFATVPQPSLPFSGIPRTALFASYSVFGQNVTVPTGR